VNADFVLLLVVMKHLLSNAIRWTEDGGEIMVSAERVGDYVRFAVADTGIGIADEHLPLIFEKFYEVTDVMLHSSGDHDFGKNGLGLGLATVRHILRTHGSECDVSSTPGEGSVFCFCLKQAT
ncbi:MAG: hypothetical protein KDD44_12480, partial [Bdellovibrionales bacterium]|nr:hypothetical protein [Bdellovibrionales bacterium]